MKRLTLWGGIFSLLIGIYLFIRPFSTTAMLGWIFALVALLSGIANLTAYLSREHTQRSIWQLIESLLSLIFGVVLLSSSSLSLSSLVISLIAYWALVTGFFRLIAGFQLRQAGFLGANRILGTAFLAIVIGFFLLFNPALSAIFIGRLAALILICFGITSLFNSFRL